MLRRYLGGKQAHEIGAKGLEKGNKMPNLGIVCNTVCRVEKASDTEFHIDCSGDGYSSPSTPGTESVLQTKRLKTRKRYSLPVTRKRASGCFDNISSYPVIQKYMSAKLFSLAQNN